METEIFIEEVKAYISTLPADVNIQQEHLITINGLIKSIISYAGKTAILEGRTT